MIKETWPISINLWKLVWISLWFSIGLIYKKKKILFFLRIWQLCCFLPQFMLLRKIYFPEVSHPSSSLWHYSSLLPLTTPASWLAVSVRSRMDGSYFGVKHLKYFRGGDFKELCNISSCILARALGREVGLKAGKLSCRDTCSWERPVAKIRAEPSLLVFWYLHFNHQIVSDY